MCRFVSFCVVLCRLRIDVRFYRFCTFVEAGGCVVEGYTCEFSDFWVKRRIDVRF